ncbi:MAG: tRNA (adenosine(37)-N6)-threonylcarbamoyltransferase complex ATPase subunit type 1 TsaE [Rhodovarius sp.]|nr:tRNA (adenosine(37)-N6)-threonylcarbamoyltransferase complex ATPase subunit type 1 TsaE [Rhodovarius sp.]MDW8315704.1 tRNA (adenosine(37)-N6)-threonylcarbamoyltransferase complex ATPase subunit type 1 TsaE [Rhodovarius sp.]
MLLPDPAATDALATRLAALARPGDAILLEGPLGAGKSAFARAFLRALAADPGLEVPSPTFTLIQSYPLPGGVEAHHLDLYRLSSPAEVAALGFEELREGIVIVEWPDRLGPLAPLDALRVVLDFAPEHGEAARRAILSGWEGRR